jgi:aldose 1-epimerase
MRLRAAAIVVSLGALCVVLSGAARYSAIQSGEIVQLQDAQHQTTVSIAPAAGNNAFEMKVKGHNVLHWPYASMDEFRKKPGLAGNPLLAPFANRLDEPAFYANGKRYAFDTELGNVRTPIPIHGFVQFTDRWKVVEAKADDKSAWVTSRLEFFRYPEWMQQWPFPHTIEMTYALKDGMLEVRTMLKNMSAEPMPVAIGFHPYFTLTDSPSDEWTISVGARTHWLLAQNKLPTGETEPIERLFRNPKATSLREHNLDDVFGDLERDGQGRATASVVGKSQRLDVVVGPNYRALVIWAPSGRPFICFEPMAGITNALNLAHKGAYKELQSVPPGGSWQESFWVRPSGF